MAQNYPAVEAKEPEKKTLIDKLAVLVFAGLALAGGLALIGLVFAGVVTLVHVL
jgi:hypothetical protein